MNFELVKENLDGINPDVELKQLFQSYLRTETIKRVHRRQG